MTMSGDSPSRKAKMAAIYKGARLETGSLNCSAEPEWFSIDAPLPMGMWRKIDAAPALQVFEEVDATNPDLWTEEREYELMRGIDVHGTHYADRAKRRVRNRQPQISADRFGGLR